MTTKNAEQIQDSSTVTDDQITDTQTQSAEDEAAFEAGFSKSRGDEPPEETPAENAESHANEGSEPDVSYPPITDRQAETLFAGKSETEIQQLFDRVPGLEARLSEETRRLYGRFGDVQSRLQKMEERASKAVIPEISTDNFEELVEEYGAELADKIVAGLKRSYAKGQTTNPAQPEAPNTPTAEPVDIEARIQDAVRKVRHEQEEKLLTVMHKDWRTIPTEPAFNDFLASLPGEKVNVARTDGSVVVMPAEAARYIESDDAMVAAECFTKYKDWKSAQQKTSSRNKNRLEQAITPRGGGMPPASTIDDEAAFLAGFKKARGTG